MKHTKKTENLIAFPTLTLSSVATFKHKALRTHAVMLTRAFRGEIDAPAWTWPLPTHVLDNPPPV